MLILCVCPLRAIANLLQPTSTLCDVDAVCVHIELLLLVDMKFNSHEPFGHQFQSSRRRSSYFCSYRFVALRETVELDSLPGMVFCPRCKQRTVSDPDSKVAMCNTCQFPFCKTCRQTWHGPGKCPVLKNVWPISI